jgi:ketol-acid reductoisomerase
MNTNAIRKIETAFYNGKTVAILGYRNNGGQQQAQSLRDKGIRVVIGLRQEDEYWNQAKLDGFDVFVIWEAVEQADIAQVW